MNGEVCVEFSKCSDPNLPFYYHTTSDQFYEGNMPTFDEPSQKPKQPKRVPCREQVHADVSGRVTMAIRDRSIRTMFHNLPVELPPPPLQNQSSILSEHVYASNGPK